MRRASSKPNDKERRRKTAVKDNRKLIDQYVRTKYGHELPDWYNKENQPLPLEREDELQIPKQFDAEVLGIRDVQNNTIEPSSLRYDALMHLPDKDDFICFLEQLQQDQEYMQCITLFTIDYMKRKHGNY